MKLRASDGTHVATVTVGANPVGVVFDGANIWVSNSGSDNVTKIRVSSGKIFGPFAVGSIPQLMAFDGANIWVTNFGGNTVQKQ
jgi:DNA-binding beta-propeller fold protein YncE